MQTAERAVGGWVARLFLVASLAVVIAATLLPGNAIESGRMPPRWCLACGDRWLTDVISNIVLFAPLGLALSWFLPPRLWSASVVVLAGLLLSISVETLQSMGIPAGRSPALADVLSNSAGALLGFAFFRYGKPLALTCGRAAMLLAVLWTLGTSTILTLTAIALGPREALRESSLAPPDSELPLLSPSAFTHVPGYSWYEATNDSASVNGRRIKRGWSGPIILTSDRESLHWTATVTVRGFDPVGTQVPLLFIHLPGDSAPLLMIAEHGRDAEMLVTRRAWDWGLAVPVLRIRNAFAGRSSDDPNPLTLMATSTASQLRFSCTTSCGGSTHTAVSELALTPLLGWAMLQTLVEVDSVLAPLILSAWLLILYAPVGWWIRRAVSSGGRRGPVIVCLLASVLVPALLPGLFSTGSLALRDWGLIFLSLTVGAATGTRSATDKESKATNTCAGTDGNDDAAGEAHC